MNHKIASARFFVCFAMTITTVLLGSIKPLLAESHLVTPRFLKSNLKSDISVYCKLDEGKWHRVVSYNRYHLVISKHSATFNQIWNQLAGKLPHPTVTVGWKDLKVPLPSQKIKSFGYGLTYPDHKKETKMKGSFSFEKNAAPTLTSSSIKYREFLDYELEIAVLMSHSNPNQFGYLLGNDLSNRKLQIHNFDKENPGPSVSPAKSFEGSLGVGPLLAIGDKELWAQLQAELSVNWQLRQQIDASKCLVTPSLLHKEFFEQPKMSDWVLVLTGTTGGTVFHAPKTLQKINAFFRGFFSVKRAKEAWLKRLQFLRKGDVIEMRSPLLGISATVVVE